VAPLVPGEFVLVEEVPAVRVDGSADARFGAAVAARDGRFVAGLPGAGAVWELDASGAIVDEWVGPGFGFQVGLDAEGPWTFVVGQGVWRLAADGEVGLIVDDAVATSVASCPDGDWARVEGTDDAVVCGDFGVLERSCLGTDCVVAHDGDPVGEGEAGGALWLDDAGPCWGLPDLRVHPAPGGWACADGRRGQGVEGDHLGLGLEATYSAGVFDKWTVPARARIVPREGGDVWVVDDAAWGAHVTLAGDEDTVMVGISRAGGDLLTDGRVYLVPR